MRLMKRQVNLSYQRDDVCSDKYIVLCWNHGQEKKKRDESGFVIKNSGKRSLNQHGSDEPFCRQYAAGE